MRGYYGIGIENTKSKFNIGTLWRSAFIYGASFIFTIGRRYEKQPTDTLCAWRHLPLYHYESRDDFFKAAIPHSCMLIGVEMDKRAKPLAEFCHPQRALYVLGSEDDGLSEKMMARCHQLIVLPGEYSVNVAVAGSIVMYDRAVKAEAAVITNKIIDALNN